ncbi:neprilysin-11-like [Haemaphysalis longicornis]
MGRDQDALEASIINVIAQYNMSYKTWPIAENNQTTSPRKESNGYINVLKKMGLRPVFSYSVSEQNGKPILLLTKPKEFYVFDLEEYDSTIMDGEEETTGSTVENYEDYYDLLAGDERAYKEFIVNTILLINELFSITEAKDVADGIIGVEKGLSKLASEATEKNTTNMSLSQLESVLENKLPITEILKKDFEGLNIDITGDTQILVEYIDYFKRAVILLKCSTMASLFNYIFWTKIRTMSEAVGTLLNDLYMVYRNSTPLLHVNQVEARYDAEGAAKPSNLSMDCVHQLLHPDVMYTAVAHYYITAKFNTTFKDDVLKIMKFVNYSFMYVVQNNTWMSTSTKEAVFKRLKSMTAVIGYPEWMSNDTIIDALYKYVPMLKYKVSFVEHYHYLQENYFKQSLLLLAPGKYINRTDEDIPLKSHAYYAPRTNTIAYPAAALVTHYRSPPIPRSANYGTIGTIIAQLFTKLMDRYEYLSKETGRYNKNNWDNATRDNFCNRSSCLNNTEECNDTTIYRTHKLETMQDYLGVRISYTALKNSTSNYTPPFLLPGEKLNSEEKIFFILFGSLYCPYSLNENRIQSRADDGDKFPDKLDEVVYTYQVFNKTFSCNLTQGADTCSLMPEKKPPNPAGC